MSSVKFQVSGFVVSSANSTIWKKSFNEKQKTSHSVAWLPWFYLETILFYLINSHSWTLPPWPPWIWSCFPNLFCQGQMFNFYKYTSSFCNYAQGKKEPKFQPYQRMSYLDCRQPCRKMGRATDRKKMSAEEILKNIQIFVLFFFRNWAIWPLTAIELQLLSRCYQGNSKCLVLS